MDTDLLWDKTGVLEKSGENVLATPISKRVKIKNLGDPAADGSLPASSSAAPDVCIPGEE